MKKNEVKTEAMTERERIERWQREHGEIKGQPPVIVDNGDTAPGTKVGTLLDAERDDSRFDFRQQDEILGSMSEAEAYEVGKDFFDDDPEVVTLGHHKAIFSGWESVRDTWKTARDGSRYLAKAHVVLSFMVDGTELKSRTYSGGFESFKRQMNYSHSGIFKYTPARQALDTLKGETVDIWVIYNDTLNELQAEFFDRKAWEARKAQEAQADPSSRRAGNGRPTERKATR